MSEDLRIAVVGAGRMGSDHIERIHHRMERARITAIVDIDETRAEAAIDGIDGARVYTDFTGAITSGEVDAVLVATPGFLHEDVLLPTLAQGLPILCEKPLTPDSASAWRVVQAESAIGRKLIQVGFMRRFDAGYQRIQQAVASGEHGELLALDCEHINPDVPAGYTGSNLIDDTVVHEFDGVRFLTGEEIASVQVRTGKNSCHATTEGLQDPAQILMDTDSGVRVSVNTHVTAQYGYAVTTRASFEETHLNEGVDQVHPGFEERFVDAYDTEVQDWIDGCLRGEVAGPDAWDGYAAAVCCEAGLRAVAEPGTTVAVELKQKPELYR
ncbi:MULTISPECIES: Gfo/Idh/MocA family protein [Kocuria]|uniref:Gfo/Idh/MocA family protein n=1 Tax=Kocuria TaxID=57493 RepID=UPI00187590DF|nr:Gfo/Idh/MocA family oxidoreductase [Kocuria indica]MCG7432069.1 Gfo/Idh/MocA family oxidoreductase [Kocuria indica]GHD84726.1 inositol 2-dehydrogenase [Kocuria marina]